VPATLDYDLWVGSSPVPSYSPLWVPWNWRGWMPFGGGVIGDWICHVVDPSFWALDLDAPSDRSAEVGDYDPAKHGFDLSAATKITFEFPARKSRGPVKLIWHDGNDTIPKPPDFAADEKIPARGQFCLATQGMIVHGSHGAGGCHLLPENLMDHTPGRMRGGKDSSRQRPRLGLD